MNKKGRSQLALGVILILLGAWFLADKSIPAFHSFFDKYTEWPVNMLLIGGVISVIYALMYRFIGPSRYGPTDAPPPKIKTKRYTR